LQEVVREMLEVEPPPVSLTDAINRASAQGWLVLDRFASLAEFERELIRERTLAGLAAAQPLPSPFQVTDA
jgi:DNA invertase Pin-like site-specific DNA recombinase